MRRIVLLLSLAACTESHTVGNFDGGPRLDVGSTSDSDPGFDVPRPRFDVGPSFDTGPRFDAGLSRRDGGPVFDASRPRDARVLFDVLAACDELCERAIECIPGTDRAECIGGCLEIEEFVTPGVCEEAAMDLFACGQAVPCEELEDAFVVGECGERFQEFEVLCDADL